MVMHGACKMQVVEYVTVWEAVTHTSELLRKHVVKSKQIIVGTKCSALYNHVVCQSHNRSHAVDVRTSLDLSDSMLMDNPHMQIVVESTVDM